MNINRFILKIKNKLNFKYFFINLNFFHLLNPILYLLPLNRNKILFCSNYGNAFGCNPKYIQMALLSKNCRYKCIWLLNNLQEFNSLHLTPNVIPIKYASIRSLYELATATVWIDNCRKEYYPIKKKNQLYIQTWHGNIGPKKIEKSAITKLDKRYIRIAKKDSKMIDICISNSSYSSNNYNSNFWYSGKVIEIGSPRNDILLNTDNINEKISSIKKKLGIRNECKIVLYAPTFRSNLSTESYSIKYPLLLNALSSKFGNKWQALLRFHPNLVNSINTTEYDSEVINCSYYPDIQELLLIADVVISDYSSILFDFLITKKPGFIFASDIEAYNTDRGFNFSLTETPFPISRNMEELINCIRSFDIDLYKNSVDSFIQRFQITENGDASIKIVELINNHIESLE